MLANDKYSIDPTFDPRSGSYRLDYRAESPWPLSTAVVLAIASVGDVAPTRLRPLNDVVDADTLNSHIRGRDRGSELSFEFHGYHVTVRDDGRIAFVPTERTERDDPTGSAPPGG